MSTKHVHFQYGLDGQQSLCYMYTVHTDNDSNTVFPNKFNNIVCFDSEKLTMILALLVREYINRLRLHFRDDLRFGQKCEKAKVTILK